MRALLFASLMLLLAPMACQGAPTTSTTSLMGESEASNMVNGGPDGAGEPELVQAGEQVGDTEQEQSRVGPILVAPDFEVHHEGAVRGRLVKRSGISDQRLAEIQMIRALKKQLERASKLAAAAEKSSENQNTS